MGRLDESFLNPLYTITIACNLAAKAVFLSDSLPIYVRDGKNVWLGFLFGETFRSSTLEDLKIQLIKRYKEMEEEHGQITP